MPCTCSEEWATSAFAREKGLSWRSASKSDGPLIEQFLANGGTGNASIDAFARAELVSHSGERFSNSHLLLDPIGQVLAFSSNSMGIVRLTAQELMGRNSVVVPDVPAMFLHRLGVLKTHHRLGLGRVCTIRVFETLRHVCAHTAAFCVALYVEPSNSEAIALYTSLGFHVVDTERRALDRTKRELKCMILGYSEAVENVTQFENAWKRAES